jgi:multidrug efflux pump subunit AcrB
MGLIHTTLRNPVAMNLTLVVLMAWGVACFFQIPREMFPEFDFDLVRISVPYPGATPDEIEESITTPIEERLTSLAGIDEINSSSNEGFSSILVKVSPDYESQIIRQKIETEIDQISSFPRDIEEPKVVEITRKTPVIFVGIFGQVSEDTLKTYADGIRDELLATSGLSQVDYMDSRDREISIEISEEKLIQHGLSFKFVADRVRSNSLNLPGGTLRSDQGELFVRTMDQKYTGRELEKLVILTNPGGTQIQLKDLATIVDDFEDSNFISLLDGVPAKVLRVNKTGNQDLVQIAAQVRQFVAKKQGSLPGSISMITWGDTSHFVKGRLDLMRRNAFMGLLLVFLTLTLFLELRLAFFVGLGIPIAFLGSFILMNAFGHSFNMISMFGMILVLGIVVDDAVVVSESIFQQMRKGKQAVEAALTGTIRVLWPVLAAVSTTVVAFMPLYFVEGNMGKFFGILPFVVIAALMLSLVECLFILPGHLAHHARPSTKKSAFSHLRKRIHDFTQWFISEVYLRQVKAILKYRYAALSASVCLLILSLGMIVGDRVQFNFMPKTDQDLVKVKLEFPVGTEFSHTEKHIQSIVEKLWETQKVMHKSAKPGQIFPFVKHIYTSIQASSASIRVELVPSETRNIFYDDILKAWRNRVAPIPEMRSLIFEAQQHGPGGKGVQIQVRGQSFTKMEAVSKLLRDELQTYPFVKDIHDNFRKGKLEARLQLKPLAKTLGIDLSEVARQLRQSYHGEQAFRMQRGKDDIRVYVRYPKEARQSLSSLVKRKIRTREGDEVPFDQIAHFEFHRGYAVINHSSRLREITVTADIDAQKGNASRLIEELKTGFVTKMQGRFPGVQIAFKGQAEERGKSMASLYTGFIIALLVIYTILATIFKSYIQPLIIMFAIPFGFIGAILGHYLMGYELSIMSMFGLVALAGIVVNNSLLLIDFINQRVRKGSPFILAVIKAGQERFMAIFLTSVTTFVGVTPMLLERSMQAQFLKPCVISLAFGLLASTVFTLLLIPSAYVILYDILALFKSFYHGRPVTREELVLGSQ